MKTLIKLFQIALAIGQGVAQLIRQVVLWLVWFVQMAIVVCACVAVVSGICKLVF